MKILITGSSGFIGTNLANRLIHSGHDCRLIDLKSPKVQSHSRLYRKVDIREFSAIKDVYFDFSPEIIFHLAARTDLSGKAISDYDTNVAGVDNICRLLLDDRVNCVGVFLSSMLVCRVGDIPAGVNDYSPPNLYGESKMLGERIVRSTLDGVVDYRILRPTSIWGPWFDEPYRFFFQRVLDRRFFKIKGVAGMKTFGFVDNTVNQIIASTGSGYNSNEVYYLGDDMPLSINTWADGITGVLGKPKSIALPYVIAKGGAILGDFLGLIGISFPLTSFRLRNISTNNVIPSRLLISVDGPPVGLDEGIKITVRWLNEARELE